MISITEVSLIKNPKEQKATFQFQILIKVLAKTSKELIPVDPAGPDCYLGEDKPCELNGIPKFSMANCSVTHDQLTL